MDIYLNNSSQTSNELVLADRFEFGKNWQKFLKEINEKKIKAAERSLQSMLKREDFTNYSFLDIGSGSGLFSLAARNLGASVTSFDYDINCVACTKYLRDRFYSHDNKWQVLEGSVLDKQFMASLGKFDLVYSWGVLHHTGDMWNAINIASQAVELSQGRFFVALYNKHWTSSIWRVIKRSYNLLPRILRPIFTLPFMIGLFVGAWLTMKHSPLKTQRGMDFYRDVVDWVGGYPYDYASIAEVVRFMENLGFKSILKKKTEGWTGCNEFIFTKD